jgi:hypothetical protein
MPARGHRVPVAVIACRDRAAKFPNRQEAHMAEVEDIVKVYESSDGGTGDPAKTVWQFFVGAQPTVTKNREIAETMRLAIRTNQKVKVTYDPAKGNTISQARIEFGPPHGAGR